MDLLLGKKAVKHIGRANLTSAYSYRNVLLFRKKKNQVTGWDLFIVACWS